MSKTSYVVAVQIGDVIKLRPSAFQAEFESMKHGTRWSQKYFYEDQFEAVNIWLPTLEQPGGNAITIFGSSQSRVIDIELDLDNKPWLVKTNLFYINYPKALERGEIEVVPFDEKTFVYFKSEEELICNIDFFEKSYLEGLFSVHERENNKSDFYKYGLYGMILEEKWKIVALQV